jgi:xanthine dehydrogenase molybdopterin-binding subunit B
MHNHTPKKDHILYGYVYGSPVASGSVCSVDCTEALQSKGIHAITPCKDTVTYAGEPVLLVAADSRSCAQTAMKKIKVRIKQTPPVLDPEEAFRQQQFHAEPVFIEKGDVEEGFSQAYRIVEGTITMGGQKHFTPATQSITAVPASDGSISFAGSGFDGMEPLKSRVATWSALLAAECKRPVCLSLDMREIMVLLGKRHPVKVHYKAGFTKEGILQAYNTRFLFDGGSYSERAAAVLQKCGQYLENIYNIPHVSAQLYVCKTNKPPNTVHSDCGAAQAVAAIEHVMDEIACVLGFDSAEVREKNMQSTWKPVFEKGLREFAYTQKKEQVALFNKENRYKKRGLALLAVARIGLSFTEVEIDLHTGAHDVIHTEILHKKPVASAFFVEKSIEDAFVQGMGWMTMEEVLYDNAGVLLTAGADTYKVPGIYNIPQNFRVRFFTNRLYKEDIQNREDQKEPLIIYSLSVWLALQHALRSVDRKQKVLETPVTKERVVQCAFKERTELPH